MARYVAATLCGIVGVLYLILLFLVADAEAGASENTYGAYLFLAVPYLVGAGLLIAVDRRPLWVIGAAVQVVIIVLFVMFGAGVFGPGQGVFDYDRISSIVVEEGTAKPYKLLERYAARLLERLLSATPATRVRVAVTKLRPPTEASVDSVTVELTSSARVHLRACASSVRTVSALVSAGQRNGSPET